METLAYLHLALAHEAPADTDYTASISTWENPKLFARFNQQKLSTSAALPLLSLMVALGIIGMASQALALVQEGSSGAEVTSLQQRLQQLGYFKANITGFFGSVTKEAVIQFQQAKGLTPDGIVGTNTEAALGEQPKSSPQPVSESSNGILQLGDRGSQVSVLQESLAAAGFSGGASGIFDEATQDAVRRFQQAKGLIVDGIVGSQTRAALPAIGGSNPASATGNGTSRLNIQALQRRLQEQGFYRGLIDGIWGPQTQAAVEAAQRAYKVSAADLKNGRF
ncbi:MAG: peptidoglycan-binding protein [Coleofasciculus sp. C3-bin4]|nr:peptidoglycan-binding protein [Coleofasciculus sp. C3-bin4]